MNVYRIETNIMNEGELYPIYHRSQTEAYKVAQYLLKQKIQQWRTNHGIKTIAEVGWAYVNIKECELRKRPAKDAYVALLNNDQKPFQVERTVRTWTPEAKWKKEQP